MTILFFVLAVLVLVLVFICGWLVRCMPHSQVAEPVFANLGPALKQLEGMGDLVVLKVALADVLEGTGNHYRGAWLVRGDALYTVNLRKLGLVWSDEAARRVVLRLSDPQINHARLDHRQTRTYDVRKTTWIPLVGNQSKLRDQAMHQAQRLIEQSARQELYLALARCNAELVIGNLCRLLGWQLTIEWEGSNPLLGSHPSKEGAVLPSQTPLNMSAWELLPEPRHQVSPHFGPPVIGARSTRLRGTQASN